jgi:dGTPase
MTPELAPYATRAAEARGRLHPEPESPPRSPFQRDRDRVIHSTAFRRLKHKTQVFVYHEGDHYRTRLTHSLEVAQIARSIARALGLDEDLTEALALAHDLGHTPFGHAGERELDHLMAPWGGFDHNAQGLRIVTRLERHYAAFDGLNLTLDTLEGLVKHNGPLVDGDGRPTARMPATIAEFAAQHGVDLSTYAAAEAQVAALADDIAYDAHDIDDGLRAKLFDVIDLGDVPLAGEALSEVLRSWPKLARPRLVHETVRRVTSRMIADVLAETRRRLARQDPQSAADICAAPHPARRLLRPDGRERARLEAVPVALALSPSADRGDHGPGPADRAQSLRVAHERRQAPAGGVAHRLGRPERGPLCPPRVRFHRRNDRPLCARVPQAAV